MSPPKYTISKNIWQVEVDSVDGSNFYLVRAKSKEEAFKKAEEFFKDNRYITLHSPNYAHQAMVID